MGFGVGLNVARRKSVRKAGEGGNERFLFSPPPFARFPSAFGPLPPAFSASLQPSTFSPCHVSVARWQGGPGDHATLGKHLFPCTHCCVS